METKGLRILQKRSNTMKIETEKWEIHQHPLFTAQERKDVGRRSSIVLGEMKNNKVDRSEVMVENGGRFHRGRCVSDPALEAGVQQENAKLQRG